uniref:Uncharacterized protein n=1 Tax=uncultured marine virus TaxID=186617 RepID=A0A0F7LB79_9VIRU|nr:hypothetical protein [uncultured marine virus]
MRRPCNISTPLNLSSVSLVLQVLNISVWLRLKSNSAKSNSKLSKIKCSSKSWDRWASWLSLRWLNR